MSRISGARLVAAALAVVLAGAVAGCGSQPAAASSTKVVVALQPETEPDWWFPIESTATYTNLNGQISDLMYLPLINVNDHDVFTAQGGAADRVTWNATGTVYHVFLKPNLKWSNGQPVTSRDVVFCWDIIKGSTLPNAPWEYGGAGSGGIPADWKSVVATTPHEVTVTLASPANPLWFVHNGLSQIWPVPASVWDKYPHNMNRELAFIESVANTPTAPEFQVVDGPWEFWKMISTQYWAFRPNPLYVGHHATIQTLVYQYETSAAAIFAGLKRGTIDAAYLPFSMWGSRGQLTNDVLSHVWVLGFTGIALNETPAAPQVGPLFQHLYIREALEMGIDQPEIIQRFYHGFAVPDYGPVPSQPGTVFYYPNLPTPYTYNPAKGKRILEEHGWHLVHGVMTKDGQALKFTLIYPSSSVTDADIVQLIQNTWAQEGIQVTLRPLEKNEI